MRACTCYRVTLDRDGCRVLIEPDSPWPPPGGDTKLRTRWQSWAAWWSGDLDDLAAATPATAPGGYWAARARDDKRRMHLPLAADIARTSAGLIFGDSPSLDFGAAAQDGWDVLSQQVGWQNGLLESAEISAAVGGVYIRPQWDTALAERPLLTVVRPDEAIPQWRFGILVSVTFVTPLDGGDAKQVLRWLEHHEPGQIRHELWRGTPTTIGKPAPLTEHPTTAGLPGEPIDTRPIRGMGLLVDYMPNVLPQPLSRAPHGRSDYQGGESFLDALDETWFSWMRDIDLGKARIVTSQEYLEPVAPSGAGAKGFFQKMRPGGNATAAFNKDAEVFTGLPGLGADDGGTPAPITQMEFKLRVQEHMDTAGALFDEIVGRGGYAPQTFGRHVEGQISGEAIRRREARTEATRNRKRQYAREAVERAAETLMLINATVFNGTAPAERPTLDWPTDGANPEETAKTVHLLRQADAVSTEIAVRMAHPEWDEDDVTDEVKRIQAERPAAPEPTGFETPDQLDQETNGA